jgi:hypothetical protein
MPWSIRRGLSHRAGGDRPCSSAAFVINCKLRELGRDRLMAKAAYDEETEARTEGKKLDWRKRMSDHIAYALMVYTALQIFVTVDAMQSPGTSIAPYIALAILVALVIPAFASR